MVLEKTLESPFNFKEIQPVYPKGNQHWTFIGRTDAEAETPTLWAPDVKNWLTGKDPDAGKDWRWEEKGTAEDEMVRWHHWLDKHESEQAPGVDDGQGSLARCNPRGHKESDMTEWLNWTEFLGFNLSSYFSSVCFLAIVFLDYIFQFTNSFIIYVYLELNLATEIVHYSSLPQSFICCF